MDDAGNAENNRARTISFYGGAKTAGNHRVTFAGVVVSEIRDFDDATAATTARETTVTFRRRKCHRASRSFENPLRPRARNKSSSDPRAAVRSLPQPDGL